MFVFNIDRGGTFTDFYVQQLDADFISQEFSFKVPSSSAAGEGPIVGIRNFLIGQKLMEEHSPKIPCERIKCINLGTTIATNALLERKGVKNAMILTSGFEDLLEIRHQARPNIFDLKCQAPEPLATCTHGLDYRIYRSPVEGKALAKKRDRVYCPELPMERLEEIQAQLKKESIDSIGISLCNSYLDGELEERVADFFRAKGVANVETGSKYGSAGYLKRTETANLDAYLNPIMKEYFRQLLTQFQLPQEVRLRVMKSDGGFCSKDDANASQLLLSGPAGGLIGYARMAAEFEELTKLKIDNLVGLDMGGTSTDISKVLQREILINYNFAAEGVEVCTPHLEIETIAAGGGSKLDFSNGMLTVGPQSVGSIPGPVCYGIGHELALTDANLILNRLDSKYFPKVFGKDKKSGLSPELSAEAFEKLCCRVNEQSENKKTIHELAEGFVEIANELMAKSARKILTMGKPDALVIFGSAAGQHCCDIGEKIGVSNVIIHKYSGVLSAFGLSKAYETQEVKVYLGLRVHRKSFDYEELLAIVEAKKEQEHRQVKEGYDEVTTEVTIGYKGTSFNLIVGLDQHLLQKFEAKHQEENGFSLPVDEFRVEYLRETYIWHPPQFKSLEEHHPAEDPAAHLIEECDVFMEGAFRRTPKYDFSRMKNCCLAGPAILLSSTASVFVKRDWEAHVRNQHIHLRKSAHSKEQAVQKGSEPCDPIKLTLYSTRLMGIAEEMGKVLQKTAISTNIKERLDFSCGIFDWDGALLANAPHLPVHLGSMETTVIEQIKRGIQTGDVVLTNHPQAGGSHLPDLTVITCFQVSEGKRLYVASRGHHADIGGLTPGSMPPFSKTLSEEGVAIERFELVKDSKFLDAETRQLFSESRRLDDNISDLQAQVSANQLGIRLLKTLVREHGIDEFCLYVKYICENAAESVANMLCNFSLASDFPPLHSIQACEYMDDGTPLSLKLTIDRGERKAIFDFTGTGPEVKANTNAPRAITKSAIIYSLRSLIQSEIPLNAGCLRPVQIIIPENCILSPSQTAAVVGGNVETSQKLVDLILKPFGYVACSQGTMNNFLFGNEKHCYYETICGGSGGGKGFEGRTVQCHMTNTRITDVEHLEDVYPVVLLAFKKRKDSGGKGKYRGGDGVTRQVMFLEEMEVSLLTERRNYAPYGLCGGQDGQKGRNLLISGEGQKDVGGKNCFMVKKFDIVRIETPSGGGYGQAE